MCWTADRDRQGNDSRFLADGRLRGVYNGTRPHAVDQLIAGPARLRRSARLPDTQTE